MAALAVAEHIISTSPVIPAEIEARCRPWAVSQLTIVLHFFDSPEAVRAFAAAFGLAVADRVAGDGVSEVQAEGVVNGCEVQAWCRISQAVTA
ncbi:hypothetical protein [Streptomyces jumonjinensis]|uniref:hypothetical protein n=1 Tax=Streptomyces jumonjinensis TaxID=1945 RepID=UPI0037917A45